MSTEAHQTLLSDVQAAAYAEQPHLSVKVLTDKVVVSGTYLLLPKDPANRERGAFARHEVTISVPLDFPHSEPKVVVTDTSVPRKDTYHCAANGECCVTVFEAWRATAPDASFLAYFDGPIRNFFLSQLVKKQTGHWPFGEWAHGIDGWVAAACELVGCKPSKSELRAHLMWRLGRSSEDPLSCQCQKAASTCTECQRRLNAMRSAISTEDATAMLDRLNGLLAKRSPLEIKREIHKNRPFRKVQ